MSLNQVAIASRALPVGVWLEVDLDAEPIVGSLSVPGEAALRFVGWIGLTAALELWRRKEEPGGCQSRRENL